MDINSTLLGQIIAFALFVWFCKVFVWPLIMEVIEERETQIADGLAAADKGCRRGQTDFAECCRGGSEESTADMLEGACMLPHSALEALGADDAAEGLVA